MSTENMSHDSSIPSWVRADLFGNVLKEAVTDFKGIQNFKVCQALAPGENYATVMLKVHVDCLLQDGRVHKFTLMLKVPHDSELHRTELVKMNLFAAETGMYRQIVPEFEQLYRDKGVEIRFGAKAYEIPVNEEYILLEDLSRRGFRNAKRQNCLDMEHCRSVLKKLAQFHAASAVWVQKNGPFPKTFDNGIIREESKGLLRPMLEDGMRHILKNTKHMKNSEMYYQQLEQFGHHMVEAAFQETRRDEGVFNVLNHGDCWSNNIMFQYNEEGHLRETYFVDLQLPSYGTPAQDLLYFLISSSQLDLKVNRFDEMIRYYHDNLIQHLQLLEYRKPLPHLRDLHQMIIKWSIWGIITIIITMAAVLCDATDTATVDNFASDSQDSQKFKELLYSNDRFKKHLEVVLPWLCNRGAFEV